MILFSRNTVAHLAIALFASGVVANAAPSQNSSINMKKMNYAGWTNCIELSNQEIDLVATTDVGPRIIRLGFRGEKNLFKEFPDHVGKTGGDKWRAYGGHRFWHAPEVMPRSYAPDNSAVENHWDGKTLRLTPVVEASTGLQKEIEITLDPQKNRVTVLHRLINHTSWPIEAAPWGLSIVDGPGRAIFPNEKPTKQLLPVRPLVLWGYTDMQDSRWTWGTRYTQLRCDPKKTSPQKFGIRNTPGWAAYVTEDQVFIKRFPFHEESIYPDFGCNCECYTNGDMLEVESVGPLKKIEPGASVEHVERWYVFHAKVGEDEKSIDAELLPLVAQSK